MDDNSRMDDNSPTERNGRTEQYTTHLNWTGNIGTGTGTYAGYERSYAIHIEGKPDITGSAAPLFRGDPALHNPEDLFVAAVSACHMLSYLALCARGGVCVVAYEDEAIGRLEMRVGGSGRFSEVLLSPVVTLARESDEQLAMKLHEEAHAKCFIANSCSVPIVLRPIVHRPVVRAPA